MARKSENDCNVRNICEYYGPGCKNSEENCEEANKIKKMFEKLSQELCPVMLELGYKKEIAGCDLTTNLRYLLIKDLSTCYQNGQCIRSILPKEITNEMYKNNPDIKKVIYFLKRKKSISRAITQP